MNPIEITKAFISKINAHDIDGLYNLMSGDHRIPSGDGEYLEGRDAIRGAWKDYFVMVPDYWIKVEKIFCDGQQVAVFGRAGGTYTADGTLKPKNVWEVPCAWLAVIQSGKILEWHIYADVEPLRRIMEREK